MAINYVSNCDWRLRDRRIRRPAREVPQFVETWEGRTDQLANFLSSHAEGTAYAGGYIADQDIDDRYPKARVDLIISMPPPFSGYLRTPSRSIKTATKSATVPGSNLIPDHLLPADEEQPESVLATREISFYAPESRYEYFTEAEPTAPLYTSAGARLPVLIRSRITAKWSGHEVEFTGATAPAAIVSALAMAVVDRVVSDGGTPIPGTPWYRCVDVVSREYQGDAT